MARVARIGGRLGCVGNISAGVPGRVHGRYRSHRANAALEGRLCLAEHAGDLDRTARRCDFGDGPTLLEPVVRQQRLRGCVQAVTFALVQASANGAQLPPCRRIERRFGIRRIDADIEPGDRAQGRDARVSEIVLGHLAKSRELAKHAVEAAITVLKGLRQGAAARRIGRREASHD